MSDNVEQSSGADQEGLAPDAGDALSLGPTPWTPTQPAPEFLGFQTPDPGYTPQPSPTPSYTPPAPSVQYADPAPVYPPMQAPTPGYSVYDPQTAQGNYAMQPYPATGAPAATFVPGQVVQTEFGTFVVGTKTKLVAGILGILLGGFGVGQFYRGNVGMGVAQILATVFTCGLGVFWGLIEGIMVLVAKPGAPLSLDSNGQLMA